MVLSGMERRLHTCRSLPMQLQQWLQLTYEIETRYFETKRLAAETQLKAAKDMVSLSVHHSGMHSNDRCEYSVQFSSPR